MKKLMENVLDRLSDHKAEGDLFYTTSKSLKLSSQKGSLSEYKVSSAQILGVRAIKDGRVGISFTESLDDESLNLLVKEVINNAEMSAENPFEKILPISGVLNDDVSYSEETVDIKHKIEKALELEAKPKSLDSRVVAVPYNSYSESETQQVYLNSHGRFTTYTDKSYSIASSALLDEKGKKANFYDYHLSHFFRDLRWDKVVQNSLFHAKHLLEEKTLPTGKYKVKFNPDCLKNLIECFGNFYSAKSAIDKVNPWADKVGELVISKDLSIIDHPLYEKSFRISKFDAEGVERKMMPLISDGVLKNIYHNSATAQYFKTQTTGHASRGAASALNVSGTHLVIQGKNAKELPPRYLEVIQMDGLYSGANRVTGNFSVGVKGYVWENGERSMTFGNMTLSGSIVELLNHVEVLSLNLESSTDESFFSVPLVFDGVSLAGP